MSELYNDMIYLYASRSDNHVSFMITMFGLKFTAIYACPQGSCVLARKTLWGIKWRVEKRKQELAERGSGVVYKYVGEDEPIA